MKEAAAGCDHIIAQPLDISAHLEGCLSTGIVVSYARPFTANNGLGALDGRYRKFTDKDFEKLHHVLLELRDLVHSHHDVVTEPKHAKFGLSAEQRAKIAIVISQEGRGRWGVVRARLDRQTFPFVKKLCEFQAARIHEDSTKLMAAFSKDKAYRAGEYTLGVDFP